MSELAQEKYSGAGAPIKAETPLHYQIGQSSGSNDAGIIIKETSLATHINLRGDPKQESFVTAVQSVLGVALPTQPGTFVISNDNRIYWLGPNEWLVIIAPASQENIESKLRATLQGHYSLVDVSGGQTLVNIRGEGVETLLKKSSVYNFNPEAFGAGRCVQSTFAKAAALFAKNSDGSFDLVIRRSFADYLARWLLDAGQEFGCRIEH